MNNPMKSPVENSSKINSQTWFKAVITALVAAIIMLFFSLLSSADVINLSVNIGFSVFMSIFIAVGSYNIISATELTSDLSEAASKIGKITTDITVIDASSVFATKALRNSFGKFICENKRLRHEYSTYISCDVKEYINEDTLNSEINSELNDSIPGIFTALGIAGTFIGLMIGLQNFDINNIDIEQMQANITALLQGIKTAFLTSIFGVILSLIYSIVSKKTYDKYYNVLDKFYSAINKICPPSDNTAINLLLKYNIMQTSAIEAFTTTLSSKISEAFSPAIKSLEQVVIDFKEYAVTAHDKSLEKIVDSFVGNMNESLNSQFTELSNTFNELNQSQRVNTEEIRSVVKEICSTAINISEINNLLNATADKLHSYVSQINEYQKSITSTNNELCDNISKFSELIVSQTEIMQSISEEQIKIQECTEKTSEYLQKSGVATEHYITSIENISAETSNTIKAQANATQACLNEAFARINDVVNNTADNSQEHLNIISETYQRTADEIVKMLKESMQQASDIQKTLYTDMEHSSQSIKEAYSEFENSIARFLQNTFSSFDSALTDVSNTLSGTILSTQNNVVKLNETTEQIPNTVYKIYDNMAKSMSANMQQEINKAIESYSNSVSTTVSSLNKAITDMTNEMEKTIQLLSELRNSVSDNNKENN